MSWLANNFGQVTLIAFHELFRPLENLGEKMVLGKNLVLEFASRIARRIYLASETHFGFLKCGRQFCKAHAADDHQVYVTERVLVAAGHRSIDKRAVHSRLKRRQDGLEGWQNTNRFLDQSS